MKAPIVHNEKVCDRLNIHHSKINRLFNLERLND